MSDERTALIDAARDAYASKDWLAADRAASELINHLIIHLYDSGERRSIDLEPLLMKIPSVAVDYAKSVLLRRWPEAEPFIMSDGRLAGIYARDVMRARWLEAEPAISQHPGVAGSYAQSVIRGRWAEAEPAILTDPITAAEYAAKVLRGEWPEAEPILLTNRGAASDYVRYARRRRWPEAEALFATNPGSAAIYARIIGRWPNAEDVILRDRFWAGNYAIDTLKQRWPELEQLLLEDARRRGADFEPGRYITHFFENGWPELNVALGIEEVPATAPAAAEADKAVATIDLPSRTRSELDRVFQKLDGLIGLDGVKTELRRIAAFASMVRQRRARGLKSPPTSLHLVFTGNPGTGKTTVARLVGEIYSALGLLDSGHVIEADRSSLVAEYAGQTDAKTKAKIAEAHDGVLFIDEAYTLAPPHPHLEFGREAINALLVEMENNRDRLAVIVAGYPREMEQFLGANPGLSSRFSRQILFDDYDGADMTAIFLKMAQDNDYHVADDARETLVRLFDEAYVQRGERFSNGRFVRNTFDQVIENFSLRFSDDPDTDLSLIVAADIPDKVRVD